MTSYLTLFSLAIIAWVIVGIVNPKTALFFIKNPKFQKRWVAVAVCFVAIFLVALIAPKKLPAETASAADETPAAVEEPVILSIDSAAVAALTPKFNFNTDEFTRKTWVEHKDTPKYRNRMGVYVYFQLVDSVPKNPRLVVQYAGDNWLFVEKYILLADGETYNLGAGEVERDNSGGRVWEWSDNSMKENELAIMRAIMDCKDVKIRYVGDTYHHDRVITDKEKKSIIETIDFYNAMTPHEI